MERIVLAYAGDRDTSAAIPWLAKRYGAEVIALTLDLGCGQELEEARDRALVAGAIRAHVLDVREEFASDYLRPALKADATYDHRDAMTTALGRPLIAQKAVEIAAMEHATAVGHGAAAGGKARLQLDAAIRALAPELMIVAPADQLGLSHAGQDDAATANGLLPRDGVSLSSPATDHPNEAAYVEVTFESGTPTAINNVAMPLVELLSSLEMIGGAHGVGREGLLRMAHTELQTLVTPPDLQRFCRSVSLEYGEVIDNGLWFTPLRRALDAFVESVQERVNGVVGLTLFNGSAGVVSRRSPFALHDGAGVDALRVPTQLSARKAPDA